MAKFHIRLKLQGLELEVEGSRDDIPAIRQSLNQQLAGLLGPATDMAEGKTSKPITIQSEDDGSSGNGSTKRRRKNRSATARNSSQGESSEDSALDWRHDTARYGSPPQTWSASDKAIWLLYVAKNEANAGEMSGSRLASTFNKQFRQAGQIQTGQVNRDLGRLKTARKGEPPLVSEDITKTPPAWFLTDTGTKHAQKLVAQALGEQQSK
jgi:hypothetical protein